MTIKVYRDDFNTVQKKVASVLGAGGTTPMGSPDPSYGYGQTVSSSQINPNVKITSAQWASLKTDLLRARQYQTGNTETLPDVTAGKLVKDISVFSDMADAIITDRNSTAMPVAAQSSTANLSVQTTSLIWDEVVRHTVSINFATLNDMRWFFNSGSRIRFQATRTGGPAHSKNDSWTNLLNAVGTQEMLLNDSATMKGYNSLTTTDQEIYSKDAEAPYNVNRYYIKGRKDATLPRLYFTIEFYSMSPESPAIHVSGTLTSMVKQYRALSPNVTVQPATLASESFYVYSQLATPVITGTNGDMQVSYSWTAVPDANNYNITWYKSSDPLTILASVTVSSSVLSFVKSGVGVVIPDTEYTIKIVATGADHLASEIGSTTASTFYKLATPEITSISGGGRVDFNWTIGNSNSDHPKVAHYYVNTTIDRGTNQSYAITDLLPNTLRTITVQAKNQGVYTASDIATKSESSDPHLQAPTIVPTNGDQRVSYTWNASPGTTRYSVKWNNGALETILYSALPYVKTGLAIDTPYDIEVTAINQVDNPTDGVLPSTPVSTATARTFKKLARPVVTGFMAIESVYFTWPSVDINGTNAATYDVVYNGTTYVVQATAELKFTISNLLVNETRTITVQAKSPVFTSSEVSLPASATSDPQLRPPAGLQAVGGDQQIVVTWNRVKSATSYDIFYVDIDSTHYTVAEPASGTTVAHTKTGIAPSTTTKIRVFAKSNVAGIVNSEISEVTAKTFDKLATPVISTITPGDRTVSFGWNRVHPDTASTSNGVIYYISVDGTAAVSNGNAVTYSKTVAPNTPVTLSVGARLDTSYTRSDISATVSGTSWKQIATPVITAVTGNATLTFNWTTPLEDGSALTGLSYDIYWNGSATVTSTTTDLTYTRSSLAAGQTYSIGVVAKRTTDRTSSEKGTKSARTWPQLAVTYTAATAGVGTVYWAWTPNETPANYTVKYDNVDYTTTATTWSRSVGNDETHTIAVKANAGAEQISSDFFAGTDLHTPPRIAITGLTGTPGVRQIVWSWASTPLGVSTTYTVLLNGSSQVQSSTSTTYTLSGLGDDAGPYYIVVRGSASGYATSPDATSSNYKSFPKLADPSPSPSYPAATTASVTFNWPHITNTQQYYVNINGGGAKAVPSTTYTANSSTDSIADGTTVSIIVSATASGYNSGQSATVTGYTIPNRPSLNVNDAESTTTSIIVRISDISVATYWKIVLNGTELSTQYDYANISIGSLSPGQQYSFKVNAYNPAGSRASGGTVYAYTRMPTVTMSAPSGVGGDYITFAWNATSPAADAYFVSKNGGSTWESAGTSTSYTWSGLSTNTQYTLLVKATKSGAPDGAASSRSQWTFPAYGPSNIRVTAMSTTSVTIAWDAASVAMNYEVSSSLGTITTNSTSASFTVTNGSSYTFVVAGLSNAGRIPGGNLSVTISVPASQSVTLSAPAGAINEFTVSFAALAAPATSYTLVISGSANYSYANITSGTSKTLTGVPVGGSYSARLDSVWAYGTVTGATSSIQMGSGTFSYSCPAAGGTSYSGSMVIPSGIVSISWSLSGSGSGGGGGSYYFAGGAGGNGNSASGSSSASGGQTISWSAGRAGTGGAGSTNKTSNGSDGGAATVTTLSLAGSYLAVSSSLTGGSGGGMTADGAPGGSSGNGAGGAGGAGGNPGWDVLATGGFNGGNGTAGGGISFTLS